MCEQQQIERWKLKALKIAKLEADKGRFISHEAIKKWVHSLGKSAELPAPTVDFFKKQ